ncbi:AAA family ATPase [Azospirillum brasilense]|nr:AAA family ATPase [Azospirillum brasilense]
MPPEPALESSNPLGTLEWMTVQGFTVFEAEEFRFSKGINVVIGENGAGKSHLLKLAYAASRALYPTQASKPLAGKESLSKAIAKKLVGVFLPDNLGRLCRRGRGRQRSEVSLRFLPPGRKAERTLSFSFSTNSSSSVAIEDYPALPCSPEGGPIFLPTREMISLSPDFSRDYTRFSTRFDETYYDLSLALVGGLRPGKRSASVNTLVAPLEEAMGGSLYVERGSGRVYLKTEGGGNLEMPLLAEGQRKLAMLAFLILNGSLARHGTIYWDEPETNLNPRLMVGLAKVLVQLAASGVQLFIATHSLFLMREIALQLDHQETGSKVPVRYFSLVREEGGVVKEEGDDIDDLSNIPALDAAIAQDEALERQYWEDRDA